MTAAHLDLYHVAWLAGGRRRASQTAVAALAENGRVRVTDPAADLQAVGAGATHPVEAAVLDALGARGHRGIETVVFLVRKDPRLDARSRRGWSAAGSSPGGGGSPRCCCPRVLAPAARSRAGCG